MGRPTLDVSPEVLVTLQDQIGFSWAEIALFRRRKLGVGNTSTHSTISNPDLDQIVRSILQVTPRVSYLLVQGALRGRGLHIQRRWLLENDSDN